jgi:hypothetical protein
MLLYYVQRIRGRVRICRDREDERCVDWVLNFHCTLFLVLLVGELKVVVETAMMLPVIEEKVVVLRHNQRQES